MSMSAERLSNRRMLEETRFLFIHNLSTRFCVAPMPAD